MMRREFYRLVIADGFWCSMVADVSIDMTGETAALYIHKLGTIAWTAGHKI